MKIHIIEPLRVGREHQPFNTALVSAAALTYQQTEVVFYGESELVAQVRHAAPHFPNVRWQEVDVAPRKSSRWTRLRFDFSLLNGIANRISNGDVTIFLSCTPATLLSAQAIARLRRNPALHILHANLAAGRHRPRFNVPNRLFRESWLIARLPSWHRAVVLEPGILDSVDRFYPDLAHRLRVLPHPITEPNVELSKSLHEPKRAEINIGMCGLLTPQKGVDSLLRIAEAQVPKIRVHLHGRPHEAVRKAVLKSTHLLASSPASHVIERQDFERRIASLDFGAFFFKGPHYELTASGVLLDYLAFGLPLFGFRNTAIKAIEAEFGEIGLFCEPGEEVDLAVKLSREWPLEHYSEWCVNLKRASNSRNIDATSSSLRTLIDRLA